MTIRKTNSLKLVQTRASNIKQASNNVFQNKKLLSDLFRNKSNQMLIDSSFSSRESSEEPQRDQTPETDKSKVQINSLNITTFTNFPDVEKKIKEAENLKSFYFMPLNSGKVELVEIPT